jgi:hypothetical protein
MKRITVACLLAGAVGAGISAGEVEEGKAQIKVLNNTWFEKIDANRDQKVSEIEYLKYGAAYLKKQGRKVGRMKILLKFDEFDRDGDGFITTIDPECRDLREVLHKKIQGNWRCEETRTGPVRFVFMEDRTVNVIHAGGSFPDRTQGPLSYRFVCPKKTPICMDIMPAEGTASEQYMKCSIQFLSENKIKMRMCLGSEFTPFPHGFPDTDDSNAIMLTRQSMERSRDDEPLTLFGIPISGR